MGLVRLLKQPSQSVYRVGPGARLTAPVGVQGAKPRENLGFYAILGVGKRGFNDDFLEAKIIESSRSICGLISLSYRHDNLVPGRLSKTKTAIPERETGGVQGPALGPRWGSRGRSPRENLGFYAILGVWRTWI